MVVPLTKKILPSKSFLAINSFSCFCQDFSFFALATQNLKERIAAEGDSEWTLHGSQSECFLTKWTYPDLWADCMLDKACVV